MKTVMRILATGLLVSSFVVACKSAGPTSTSTPQAVVSPTAETSNLTRKEAQGRAERVRNVVYTLNLKLNETDETFRGQSVIAFDLKETKDPLRIDFFEGEVTRLKVNGKSIESRLAKHKYWIELAPEWLKQGANTVAIDYTHTYSQQGQGLSRFKDPQTGEIFLHTQFETFDANRFMPCFDQPDLKANLHLTVEAPAKWEVISTTAENTVTKAGTRRLWKFDKTALLSTYVFSLHAGPFKVWRDRFEDIPLRLFARPSLAKYVRAQDWFTITKQGLRFYNSFFAYPYPFKKYHQLFIPEFSSGAMENVGAVTFSERFIKRSEVTRDQRRSAASVILHEMAHMWFGDLVTMKWWNDLWLNESFATIMAAIALHDATEFKESWQDFFAGDKSWAYWQDGLNTTHPIEAPVETVKEAYANFDGITYGKGAAVMKQLRAYMTPEAFKAGVQAYFKTHAYKNAELSDFISSLQTQTQLDLKTWADRWLKQTRFDKVAVQWSCTGARLKQIEIVTTPAEATLFRPQTVQVGLYKEKGGQWSQPEMERVLLTQNRQTLEGDWTCPDFIYPNAGDDGYLAVSLDTKSMAYLKGALSRVPESLLRTMIWNDLWEMVRNAELPLKEYVKLVEGHFRQEKDNILLDKIVKTLIGRRDERGSVIYFWPESDQARADLNTFVGHLERDFLSRFRSAKAGSDSQKFWFDSYLRLARSPTALDQLARWAGQSKIGPGFPLDLDRNWNLVRQLARFQHKDAPRLLEALRLKDASDMGTRQALATEAIQPDFGVKEKWMGSLTKPKPSLPLASVEAVLGSLFPVEQMGLARRFEADFYSYLKNNGASEDEVYVESFAWRVTPLSCEGSLSGKLKEFLSSGEKLSPTIEKALKTNLEEDERCQRVRAMAAM